MSNIALVSLGCAKNLVDSEVMLGVLNRAGYGFVGDIGEADVIIINTCGFIGAAREEARSAIRRALKVKKANPEVRIVVAGCFVERSEDELRSEFPGVDIWTGVADFDRIDEMAEGWQTPRGDRTFLCGDNTPRVISTPPGWAYLKISEGCSHRCAFCAIPSIKGPYRSRPAASVVREARTLASLGVKEIVLVSQDSTWYGRDRKSRSGLAGLLGDLSRIRGLAWIRFLYGYPGEVDDELLEVMNGPKICRYLDIPFQHADAGVVKAMYRGLDGRRSLALIERIRRSLPGAAIRTSLIVGFPGEGRREFEALKGFVREARFEHLGVFEYSREPGTPAFGLGDTVTPEEKADRRREIMELQAGISLDINRSFVGRKVEVLIEDVSDRKGFAFRGRMRTQAPEVDGGIELAVVGRGRARLDSPLVEAEVVSAGEYDLEGRIIR